MKGSPTSDSITIQWDAVSGAATYTAKGSPGNKTGTVKSAGAGTEATFTGLTANTDYTFTVEAVPTDAVTKSTSVSDASAEIKTAVS